MRRLTDLQANAAVKVCFLVWRMRTPDPRVSSSIDCDEAGKFWLNLQVSDEGIGIAPENQKRIFEPFQQVNGSLNRQYGGNGIGLALCGQLAHHMKGAITVNSELGQGATFSLRIPTEICQAPEFAEVPAQDAASQIRARHAGAQVLVAEDDRSLQALISATLESAGLTVFIANDGSEAIESAKSAQFHLILLDLMMPKVSGIDAARTIRALPHYQAIPILAVTARAFEEDREECLRAGMNAHVPKPITPNLLLSLVLEWLDFGKQTQTSS